MKKRILAAVIGTFILVITLGSMGVLASANGTEVTGIIDVDTVWEKTKGPYYINSNVLVDEGVKLTIEEGTQVQFNGSFYIQIKGNINVLGNYENPVVFKANSDVSYALQIKSSGNIIKHCEIYNKQNYGDSAVLTLSSSNNTITNLLVCSYRGLRIEDGANDNTIAECIFDSNEYAVLAYGGKDNTIKNTNIRGSNGEIGIMIGSYSYDIENFKIENCTIENYYKGIVYPIDANFSSIYASVECSTLKNNTYGIHIPIARKTAISKNLELPINNNNFINCINNVYVYNEVSSYDNSNIELDILNNYWGDTDSSQISTKINDYYDDFNLPKVYFDPFLTTPYGFNLVNSNYPSGEYIEKILVELSVSTAGDIYYTLDGTDPTVNGVKYISPITVSQDTVISCVSFLDNIYSEVISYEYKITKPIVDYTIKELYISNFSGELIGDGKTIPQSGKFFANISVVKNVSSNEKGLLFIATYTDEGQLIDYNIMSGTYNQNQEIIFSTTLDNTDGNIGKIKTFVWTSLTSLKPLSNSLCIE